jgi:mannonate dehydratase
LLIIGTHLLDGPHRPNNWRASKLPSQHGQSWYPDDGVFFSGGPWGRAEGSSARGQAVSVGFHQAQLEDTPIPNGLVWNMFYDQDAPAGTIPSITEAELWRRLREFLMELVPVAEEAGVKLAAHRTIRLCLSCATSALIYQREFCQKLLDIVPAQITPWSSALAPGRNGSSRNGYLSNRRALQPPGRDRLCAFRNIIGHVPDYDEVFVDEGMSICSECYRFSTGIIMTCDHR